MSEKEIAIFNLKMQIEDDLDNLEELKSQIERQKEELKRLEDE